MKLTTKTTLFTFALSGAMLSVLVIISVLAFRQFSISTAQEHVRTAAQVILVGLTEAMINGVIDQRQQTLERLAQVPGLMEARVIRGQRVVRQFGEGLDSERSMDEVELKVLETGKPYFKLNEGMDPTFRGTIPFTANSAGTPNCLQCHEVENGTVLGAITLTLSMSHLRRQAMMTIFFMTGILGIFTLIITWVFRTQIAAVVATAAGVQQVVSRAKDGDFSERIDYQRDDEIGQIARDLNQLMNYLQENLGNISKDVARLIQYELEGNTNLLTTTTEMVGALVEVAHFKQAVEEDQTKQEVYARLGRMLSGRFGIRRYTIYEVTANQNHMKPMVVDGEVEAACRWCNPQILFQSDACRAQRTGHIIDSVETPQLCNMFQEGENEQCEHICIPVIHSGSVGMVVQLVVQREHGSLFQLLLPFIKVFLRESAPVVQAKRLLATLRESALRDAMTGLHNRRFLEEYLQTLVASTKRKQNHLAVMMMDLDHFKSVNDTYGHDAGDTVLKALAKVLVSQVRSSDMVIRYGGEEFLVLLQEQENHNGAAVAEKIRAAVAELKIPVAGGILEKTISIGLATFPEDGDDFWDVTKKADLALYKAKESGRNRVIIYEPGLEEEMAPDEDKK
ncbi:sensor domain-containing diguanylate cyclase [Magnetofaba australis]|uniref:diguanylate cyclase n=1 Tax=Magnetofaba australis IT-1 TaxID=1434232 RepID=A0A1Y2KB25_9PROT|nr:diguanylate cyclase [Magnetofaba australis]OSM07015.1 putative diguanylate cyclase [Magnetofaba australis IT-1]